MDIEDINGGCGHDICKEAKIEVTGDKNFQSRFTSRFRGPACRIEAKAIWTTAWTSTTI